jgi:hypothetical protein
MPGIVAGNRARVVRIDPDSGEQSLATEIPVNFLHEIDLDPVGNLIAVGDVRFPDRYGSETVILLINLETGARTELARGGLVQGAIGIGINASGEVLVAGSALPASFDDRAPIVLLDGTGRQRSVETDIDSLSDVVFGLDGDWFATNRFGAMIRVNPQTGASRLLTYTLYDSQYHFIVVE